MENQIKQMDREVIGRKPFPVLHFLYPIIIGSLIIVLAYYSYDHISIALKGSGFSDMNYFIAAAYKIFGLDGLFYVIFATGTVFYLLAIRVVSRFFKEMFESFI